jgi:TRAP-type C4-dicarboxylate transport system permease small subunit
MKRVVQTIYRVQSFVAIIFLIIFVITVILQVVTRYVPGIVFLWTEQIAVYTFIWTVMMGASIGVRAKQHFYLSIFTDKMSEKVKRYNNIFLQVLIIIFGIFLTYHGVVLTKTFWNWSLTSLPHIKQGYFWLCLPITGSTMTIYSIYNVYEFIKANE